MKLDLSYLLYSSTPGYLLQTLPFAAAAGAVFWFLKYRRDRSVPLAKRLLSVLFVCYIADVICIAFFLSSIRYFWGFLLLHNKAENIVNVLFREGTVNLIPDFYRHFDQESLLNVLLYVPFGFLYPLVKTGGTWRRTVSAGATCIICSETLQPFVGRTFAVDDIILNACGLLAAATLYFLFARIMRSRKRIAPEETERGDGPCRQ